MRYQTVILLLFLCLFLCGAGQDSYAQEEPGVIETLRFKEADIRVVLQAITQKAVRDEKRVNILVAPDVKGLVTVDLENVDWLTALEAVLKTYDYGYEWVGKNIVLVDTLENLAEKRKKAQEAQVAEPLETQVFTLNFAKVVDIQEPVEHMLTARGKLTYDTRTNTLVINDTQSNLATISESIASLDAITPQVLIEAKVIETDLDVTHKLGVKWNLGTTDGEPTTFISGSKRPHTYPFTAHSDEKYFSGDDFPSNTSGFTNGTLDASSFSAAMQVLFEDTDTQILSEPKITTLDNNTATIDVVTEDPLPNYTYNSETGAWEISGFDWLKYGVSLIVTPQINQEGFVTLTVKPVVSENIGTREFSSGGSSSTINIPILNTQTTTTKVMIRDGETLVIGGLVRDKTIDKVNKIPFLGDIPVLGYLFKHKGKTVVKKNLLIFITPKIVTPQRQTAEAK